MKAEESLPPAAAYALQEGQALTLGAGLSLLRDGENFVYLLFTQPFASLTRDDKVSRNLCLGRRALYGHATQAALADAFGLNARTVGRAKVRLQQRGESGFVPARPVRASITAAQAAAAARHRGSRGAGPGCGNVAGRAESVPRGQATGRELLDAVALQQRGPPARQPVPAAAGCQQRGRVSAQGCGAGRALTAPSRRPRSLTQPESQRKLVTTLIDRRNEV